MSKAVSIVDCYNNGNEVYNYSNEFFSLDDSMDCDLVITINSASEKDIKFIEKLKKMHLDNIYIYYSNDNLGYLKGMIYGYKKYISETSIMPDYVIMSNTDIKYDDKLFLKKLFNIKIDKNVWCIGPSLYAINDNTYDNPVKEERRTLNEVSKLIKRFENPIIGPIYVSLSGIKHKIIKKKKDFKTRYVYEVHGAYFILTKDGADYISI